ncbi:hypothetical protein ALC53_12024 [Atta colombica]|uniref:Uncharacterized protein n=1 Tax=Atta colombica TaxID=520822 RepID=A0A195AZS1_9HYME|nr:hypothetical protein ALC53_12024 [Atta colombica]
MPGTLYLMRQRVTSNHPPHTTTEEGLVVAVTVISAAETFRVRGCPPFGSQRAWFGPMVETCLSEPGCSHGVVMVLVSQKEPSAGLAGFTALLGMLNESAGQYIVQPRPRLMPVVAFMFATEVGNWYPPPRDYLSLPSSNNCSPALSRR